MFEAVRSSSSMIRFSIASSRRSVVSSLIAANCAIWATSPWSDRTPSRNCSTARRRSPSKSPRRCRKIWSTAPEGRASGLRKMRARRNATEMGSRPVRRV